MIGPGGSWASPIVSQPYRRPCIVVPRPDDYKYCGAPSDGRTALGYPVCDECYAAISAEGLEVGEPVTILGMPDES